MNCYSEELVPIYKKLGIDIKKLFCVMANVEWTEEQNKMFADLLENSWAQPYTSSDKSWIKWYVYGNHPHVTVLYGLLDKVDDTMVKTVLSDWTPDPLTIKEISYFDSPDQEEYYCIIAKVDVTQNLLDARSKLELLPHINTFPDYKAHITIGYIQKDKDALDKILSVNKKQFGLNALRPIQAPISWVVYDNNSWDPITII